jgi:hypothetical protein
LTSDKAALLGTPKQRCFISFIFISRIRKTALHPRLIQHQESLL